jgi:hypothetical protein
MLSDWPAARRILWRGTIALAGAALLIGVVSAPSSAAPAQASTPTTPPARPSGHVLATAQLTLDCATLTTAGKRYAKANGICGYGDGVSPSNVVAGNCGTSFIWVYNNGGGDADILWGFGSSLGPVFYRDLTIAWYNWDSGGAGSYHDANWMASSSYSKSRVFHTYAGYVTVGLSGSVENSLGTCSVLSPTDWIDVT